MDRLPQLHDKVKFHRYRDDIVANASACKRYVSAFQDLLDAFQKEIDKARLTPPEYADTRSRMLVEMENRCFLIDARRKLTQLSYFGELYRCQGGSDTERSVRILMAQLEGTLSSIHEYIAYGKVSFLLRYPADDSLEAVRLSWRQTDYVPL